MQYLDLPIKYEGRVRLCFDVITKLIPGSEIYLFGNYAKGYVGAESMISLLVLIGIENSVREIHRLRWEVEEMVYRINDEVFQIELIILPAPLYKKYMATSSKLKQIERGKIDLMGMSWR